MKMGYRAPSVRRERGTGLGSKLRSSWVEREEWPSK